MKFNIFVLVAVLAAVTMATARPDTVLDFEGDEHQHQQEGDAGNKVEGSYSWTSPEGEEFYVRYVADEDGYRVLESNAVPVSHGGAQADGNQGAFGEGEGEGGEGESGE
ncbi:larval cuticle protein 2-like [Penaeus monodon]|uniref:larval cuticle protein 2-like n=1 Tax=Penaeus monodon TaxID=6687 RepID=UPI0018A7C9BD|nr:larval cuticle protein 2-like [Penaeus monodon]